MHLKSRSCDSEAPSKLTGSAFRRTVVSQKMKALSSCKQPSLEELHGRMENLNDTCSAKYHERVERKCTSAARTSVLDLCNCCAIIRL